MKAVSGSFTYFVLIGKSILKISEQMDKQYIKIQHAPKPDMSYKAIIYKLDNTIVKPVLSSHRYGMAKWLLNTWKLPVLTVQIQSVLKRHLISNWKHFFPVVAKIRKEIISCNSSVTYIIWNYMNKLLKLCDH